MLPALEASQNQSQASTELKPGDVAVPFSLFSLLLCRRTALLPRPGPVTTQNTRIALPVTPQELKLCWSHSGWYGTFEVSL